MGWRYLFPYRAAPASYCNSPVGPRRRAALKIPAAATKRGRRGKVGFYTYMIIVRPLYKKKIKAQPDAFFFFFLSRGGMTGIGTGF